MTLKYVCETPGTNCVPDYPPTPGWFYSTTSTESSSNQSVQFDGTRATNTEVETVETTKYSATTVASEAATTSISEEATILISEEATTLISEAPTTLISEEASSLTSQDVSDPKSRSTDPSTFSSISLETNKVENSKNI